MSSTYVLISYGASGGRSPNASSNSHYLALPIMGIAVAPQEEVPTPVVGSVSPDTVTQYDGDTQITIGGSGFIETSVVSVLGQEYETTYLGPSELRITLPGAENVGALLRTDGTYDVTVANGASVSNAETLTVSAWTPASITGLTAWFRADAADITIGTGVSQWADKSGNGRHISQGTGGAQPVFTEVDSDFNNRGSVDFDGTDDRLASAAAASSFLAVNGGWILSVFRADAISTDSGTSYSNVGVWDAGGGNAGLHLRSTGPTALAYSWDGADQHANVTVSTGATEIVTWRKSATMVTGRRRLETEVTDTAGNISSLAGPLRVGGNFSTAYFNGRIAEVITANVDVSEEDRERAIRYAIVRYNVI